MQLARVIETSAAVAGTSSRTAKVAALAATLRVAAPEEVGVVTDYLAGRLPQRTVGVGWRGLQALPEPALESTLSVQEVDEALSNLQAMAGAGSSAARGAAVVELFGRATESEQRWLVGLITGELRQGAGDGVMLKAIAEAAGVPEGVVRRAVMLAGFAGPVAAAALGAASGADAGTGGGGGETAVAALEAIELEVGRPLRPMLAGSAPAVAEVVDGATEVAVDTKVDGIRLQAHLRDGSARLFTRTLEDVTDRMPEVVEVLAALPARQAVLDGEVIALADDGRPEPFQITGARTASTADPGALRVKVPLTTFLFDLLHLDGRDLVDEPASERWSALAALAPDLLVPRIVTDNAETAQEFFAERVAAGHEGVVIKSLDAPYAAGRRGAGWVKVKPRHTLDLVVLAVEWGSGRRRGWLSNIHLGARHAATGELVMLGKTFKGMTDEMLAWQTQRFLELETHREGHVVHVRPEQVVEIAYDGVQRSTRYPGGVALRFARVLRYRDDKPVSEIDTVPRLT
ncbi:ATP-dependent DNA ligase [Ornithinimicrobium faecis]|uniref:DNA ligase (ATP) n=1 Tax=Ornithinimicrobium faecis TaxID=2934158 RepID=A0ABY4YVC7_9MICO|nr:MULTISPECIES: ATP-dependent DNA ligase [unclassified Ornithinimicrobium]USQ80210.1 ATP-dependent DNA ligase [Ornithinimicrobium sp. HY1793]